MKVYISTDYNLDKMFIAESPEELSQTIIKRLVANDRFLLRMNIDKEDERVIIEWEDKYCERGEFYIDVYEYRAVEMNSCIYLR